MIIKDLIKKAILQLSTKRKLFWSEADFQFSLALVLRDILPENAKIYLERPIAEILSAQQEDNNTKNRKKFYVDIWIQIEDTVYPIELKYGTKKQEIKDWDRKSIKTVNQAAYDITRFGYLFDIHRIEHIKKHLSNGNELKFGRGFAILLTNDANYHQVPKRDFSQTRDALFRLHERTNGEPLPTKVKWNYNGDEKHWTEDQYPYNVELDLPSNFNLDWNVYLQDKEQGADIRYLINTIE